VSEEAHRWKRLLDGKYRPAGEIADAEEVPALPTIGCG
jgi:hypothetical protein